MPAWVSAHVLADQGNSQPGNRVLSRCLDPQGAVRCWGLQVPAKPVRSEEDAILDLAFRQAQAPRLLGSALCKLICKPHF